jgi:type IV pilus assembly protein PilA
MRTASRQGGFTIIEVMIVVMIIGVLASIVLPAIRSYTARAKMSEALLAFAPCRNIITEIYQSGGDPPTPGNWGCEITSNASKYVDTISTWDPGPVIKVSLRGFSDLRIDTHDLTMMPLDNTGSPASGIGSVVRTWRCGSAADGTQVPAQFLPASCRG